MTTRTTQLLNKNLAFNGRTCPFCGERDGIESNIQGPREYSEVHTFGCHGGNGCGEQWDAADYQLTEEEADELREALA